MYRMPDRLLLRLAPDGGLTWLRQRAGAPAVAGSVAGAPPASALAGARAIVVLVPTEDVLLTEVKLAARNRAQLLQAVPYAVEDLLLDPVEDLHFAAARTHGDTVGVAVVAQRTLRGWLERLSAEGIEPDVLVPDALALPATPGRVHAMIENGRATLRLAPWSAFACTLPELDARLARLDDALPLEVHDFREAPPLALPGTPAAYHERRRDPLAWLGQGHGDAPLNLLEGRFAPRRRARGSRAWKIAAGLAAAVVLLAFADLGGEVLRLSRASTRLEVLARDEVRKAFPGIDAAQLDRLSPEQLVRDHLERLRGGAAAGELLQRLASIGPVLGSSSRVQTRGLEYRNGTLELALRAPDVAALDLVRERLGTVPGLRAEVTAANPGPDGVDGRIRIVAGSTP
jgi:general secretion pathway protein L